MVVFSTYIPQYKTNLSEFWVSCPPQQYFHKAYDVCAYWESFIPENNDQYAQTEIRILCITDVGSSVPTFSTINIRKIC